MFKYFPMQKVSLRTILHAGSDIQIRKIVTKIQEEIFEISTKDPTILWLMFSP